MATELQALWFCDFCVEERWSQDRAPTMCSGHRSLRLVFAMQGSHLLLTRCVCLQVYRPDGRRQEEARHTETCRAIRFRYMSVTMSQLLGLPLMHTLIVPTSHRELWLSHHIA